MIRRVACLAAVLALLACDVSIGSLAGRASDEWTRSYKLSPGGEFRIRNTNGRIDVEGGDDPTVEVRAERIARAVSNEAARELLPRIVINEDVKTDRVSIETGRLSGIMIGAGFEVRYHVRAPKSVVVNVSNTNGQITLKSLSGRVTAHTTNGGVRGNALSGGVDATTTNGGVDVEFASVGADRISLSTTNGGVTIDLPPDAKADVLATCTNGGISVSPDVKMQVTEQSRRRFEGKMNGGGTPVDLRTTNGGIRIRSRGLAEKTTESR